MAKPKHLDIEPKEKEIPELEERSIAFRVTNREVEAHQPIEWEVSPEFGEITSDENDRRNAEFRPKRLSHPQEFYVIAKLDDMVGQAFVRVVEVPKAARPAGTPASRAMPETHCIVGDVKWNEDEEQVEKIVFRVTDDIRDGQVAWRLEPMGVSGEPGQAVPDSELEYPSDAGHRRVVQWKPRPARDFEPAPLGPGSSVRATASVARKDKAPAQGRSVVIVDKEGLLHIQPDTEQVSPNAPYVVLRIEGGKELEGAEIAEIGWDVTPRAVGDFQAEPKSLQARLIFARDLPQGIEAFRVRASAKLADGRIFYGAKRLDFDRRIGRGRPRATVTLDRANVDTTVMARAMYPAIRYGARALSFRRYQRFIDFVFCGDVEILRAPPQEQQAYFAKAHADALKSSMRLPFPGIDPYRLLKAATEVFVLGHCGVWGLDRTMDPVTVDPVDEERRNIFGLFSADDHKRAYQKYLDSDDDPETILPYFAIVLSRLPEVPLLPNNFRQVTEGYAECEGILRAKLQFPCLIELIWSYWHEEAMLAQTMNAISQRFQNLRAPGPRDPLAQLEIDPLRPLNNLLWGYVQDEQHRLSVLRRAHEYDHHYGITLYGKAVADLRTADVRSKFLESFHNLLYQAVQFYRQDDDTTVKADGFPVLNALKETHYLLAQGMHNQFGDLPATARQEMLIEQWLLSRPEMREFLGGRT